MSDVKSNKRDHSQPAWQAATWNEHVISQGLKKKKKPLDEQIIHEGMSSQMIPSNLH